MQLEESATHDYGIELILTQTPSITDYHDTPLVIITDWAVRCYIPSFSVQSSHHMCRNIRIIKIFCKACVKVSNFPYRNIYICKKFHLAHADAMQSTFFLWRIKTSVVTTSEKANSRAFPGLVNLNSRTNRSQQLLSMSAIYLQYFYWNTPVNHHEHFRTICYEVHWAWHHIVCKTHVKSQASA